MRRAEDYAYRVLWSAPDEAFVGTVAEFPSLSCVEDGQAEAFFGIIALVEEVIRDMEAAGDPLPEPIGSRKYTGKFPLRMTPEQHRALALEAAEQHVSLNHLIASRL